MTGPPTLSDVHKEFETLPKRRYQAYPSYKDSGVEWLGKIPGHWEVKRLKYLSRINPSQSETRGLRDDYVVSFVPMEAVSEYGGLHLEQTRRLGDVKNGFTYFREGDVVVAKITPCFENGKGSIAHGLTQGIAFGTTELHVLRPLTSINGNFIFYLTISHAFRLLGASEMYGAGGQKRVPTEFVRNFWTALPPEREQHVIASFLDHQTQKIDDLISAKRELLALLKEKRQAVITHAVTKGLDPNVKLKPSGIDWLGDVPEHWGIVNFRRIISQLEQGWSPVASNYPAIDGEEGVLKLNAVHKGKFCPKENKALEDIPKKPSVIKPEYGDLLITRSNTPQLVGDVCVVKSNYPQLIISDLIFKIKLTSETEPRFVCWFFLSSCGRAQIETYARGSSESMVKLGQNQIRRWMLPLPLKDEQIIISDYLDAETSQMDNLSTEIQTAITKLQEYRTALISAAVTGKIDVRGYGPY